MFRSILVATDGSDSANAALQLAADLCAKYDAKLSLLHVAFRGGDVPAEKVRQAQSRFDAALEAQGKSPSKHPQWSREHQVLDFLGEIILDEAACTARDLGAPVVGTTLDYGDTAERIRYWEERSGADLIVIGSRGYSELKGLLLGSVSHAVHQRCHCACVTVKRTDGGSPDAFSGLSTVLVAVDGSAHAYNAVKVASDIALKYGAKLIVEHVMLKRATLARLVATVDLEKLSETSRQFLRERESHHGLGWTLDFGLVSGGAAKQVFEDVGGQILLHARRIAERNGLTEVSTHFDEGEAAPEIVERANKERADVIVLGDRGLGEIEGMFVGSVSNKVQHLAPCTTISVKQQDRTDEPAAAA